MVPYGVLRFSFDAFRETLSRERDLQDAEIISTELFQTDLGAKRRFLLVELRLYEVKSLWLRIEREVGLSTALRRRLSATFSSRGVHHLSLVGANPSSTTTAMAEWEFVLSIGTCWLARQTR